MFKEKLAVNLFTPCQSVCLLSNKADIFYISFLTEVRPYFPCIGKLDNEYLNTLPGDHDLMKRLLVCIPALKPDNGINNLLRSHYKQLDKKKRQPG